MKKTNHKTITPEGKSRKVQRLVLQDLRKLYPAIYIQLVAAAEALVDEENKNPLTTIKAPVWCDEVTHTVSERTRQLQYIQRQQRKAWAEARIGR